MAITTGVRRLVLGLLFAAVAASGTPVEAASVSVTWNAPTTNADGSRLTDLTGYRIYLGTAAPACPSASFHSVSSPTGSPSAGSTVSTTITALTANTTYFARVTAVDSNGNESPCSASASGVAKADFTVTPTTATAFGSVAVNGTIDRTFTVQNTSSVSISGTASAGAPFSVVSGASFTLAAGASQTVTVRFKPTAVGSFAGNVTFTASGDTVSRGVSGSGASSTSLMTLSITKNGTGTGTVTSSPAGISCGTTCSQTVAVATPMTLTATAAAGSVFAGWSGACTGTGACALTVRATVAVTATFNAVNPVPVASSLSPSTAVAKSAALTLTVNGSGFVASSVVRWSGANRTTTFVSASQLKAAITATDLATVRSVPVTVFTPTPGGGTSASLTFTVTAAPPPPPPPAPAAPTVTKTASDASGVTYSVSWTAVTGAASYRWVAVFNDGTGSQQGSVTARSFQLRMPYHSSGAASGASVCIWSVDATGQRSTNQACSAVAVPARPVAPPPPPVAPPPPPPPPPDYGWGVG